MAQLLIRDLDTRVVERLKARARRHGRSLQGEAKSILTQTAGIGSEDIAAMLDGWKKRFAGRHFSSSAAMIR